MSEIDLEQLYLERSAKEQGLASTAECIESLTHGNEELRWGQDPDQNIRKANVIVMSDNAWETLDRQAGSLEELNQSIQKEERSRIGGSVKELIDEKGQELRCLSSVAATDSSYLPKFLDRSREFRELVVAVASDPELSFSLRAYLEGQLEPQEKVEIDQLIEDIAKKHDIKPVDLLALAIGPHNSLVRNNLHNLPAIEARLGSGERVRNLGNKGRREVVEAIAALRSLTEAGIKERAEQVTKPAFREVGSSAEEAAKILMVAGKQLSPETLLDDFFEQVLQKKDGVSFTTGQRVAVAHMPAICRRYGIKTVGDVRKGLPEIMVEKSPISTKFLKTVFGLSNS